MKLYWTEWAAKLNLTQAEIGRRTVMAGHPIGVNNINVIFAGKQDPQLRTICTLAGAMGLTLADLEKPPG